VTYEFWIGIVFWCIGKDCGMITTKHPFVTREECKAAVQEIEDKLRKEPTKKDIIDGRCGDHLITINQPRI